MKRRRFLSMLMRAAVGAPVLAAAAYILPKRVTEALRVLRYPGRVEPLNHESLRRPGHWLG